MKKWISWIFLAAPYLLTTLFSIISVLFLGNTILVDHSDRVISDKAAAIQNSYERIIQKTETVEELGYTLSANDLLINYFYHCMNHIEHSPLDLLELQKLFVLPMMNPVIYEIFLMDSADNCVTSSSAAVSKISNFFQYSYIVQGHTASESISRLKHMPKSQKYCPSINVVLSENLGQTKQILEYRLFLPLNGVLEFQSQLIIAMDADELFSELKDAIGPDGEFYVYDSYDVLIFQSGNQYEALLPLSAEPFHKLDTENGNVYGSVMTTAGGKWKIKAYIPELVEENNMAFLSPAILLFVVLPVFISILLTVFFTHKNYQRIYELLEMFRGHTDKEAPLQQPVGYRLVQEYAGEVIKATKRANQQVSEYACSRKYEVLDKLLRNTYYSRQEAVRCLTEAALNIRDKNNIVMCIRHSGTSYEMDNSGITTIRSTVHQLLSELIDQPCELLDTSSTETVCVISLDDTDLYSLIIQDIISHLNVEIAYYYGIEVVIGVGKLAEEIDQLGESYEQARAVIRYQELSGIHVNLYTELVQLEDLYFYPKEYDEKILDYVVAGKKEEALRIIQKIYEENFVNNTAMLSLRAIASVKNRLLDCVASISERYNIPLESFDTDDEGQNLRRILGETNVKRYFALISETVDLLAEKIQGNKITMQSKLGKRIQEYVQENFRDQKLSLTQISAVVGVHENYISILFKNVYGENLSSYLERLRIEKACELIRNSPMKIEEIAQAVGYASAGNFRRAFKKVKGISPTEYRDQ